MASKVNIYNMALLHVGATTIAAVDDDAKGVRVLDQFYDTVRDKVLAAFPWNFAIKQAALVQLAAVPTFGYAYAYQIPTDCLNVLKISPENDFRIAKGGALETDYDNSGTGADPLNLEYVCQITDETKFTPHFAETLALALAVDIAVPMTSKVTLRDELWQRYNQALGEAQTMDWRQDVDTTEDTDTWILARG